MSQTPATCPNVYPARHHWGDHQCDLNSNHYAACRCRICGATFGYDIDGNYIDPDPEP